MTTVDQKTLFRCISEMNLCNVGEEYLVIVKLILIRAELHDPSNKTHSKSFYEELASPGDGLHLSPTFVEFVARTLDARDLLDYGTGIGWAFLTEEGKLLLEFLQEFGANVHSWPEWSYSQPLEESNNAT